MANHYFCGQCGTELDEPVPALKVYVLFVETNSGDAGGDSDGYVDSLFASYESAQARRAVLRQEAAEREDVVWPADDEDEEEPEAYPGAGYPDDWDVCFQIRKWEVRP